MLSDEQLVEIEQTARRFGSANCWTGPSGELAGMLIELLKEVIRLQAELTASHSREAYWREKDCED